MTMKNKALSVTIFFLFAISICRCTITEETKKVSPGNTTYYINPANGNDENSGLKENLAWRTFSRVNKLQFSPGDRVEITSPGYFDQTLMLMGEGTIDEPVEVHFAKGRYDFFPR